MDFGFQPISKTQNYPLNKGKEAEGASRQAESAVVTLPDTSKENVTININFFTGESSITIGNPSYKASGNGLKLEGQTNFISNTASTINGQLADQNGNVIYVNVIDENGNITRVPATSIEIITETTDENGNTTSTTQKITDYIEKIKSNYDGLTRLSGRVGLYNLQSATANKNISETNYHVEETTEYDSNDNIGKENIVYTGDPLKISVLSEGRRILFSPNRLTFTMISNKWEGEKKYNNGNPNDPYPENQKAKTTNSESNDRYFSFNPQVPFFSQGIEKKGDGSAILAQRTLSHLTITPKDVSGLSSLESADAPSLNEDFETPSWSPLQEKTSLAFKEADKNGIGINVSGASDSTSNNLSFGLSLSGQENYLNLGGTYQRFTENVTAMAREEGYSETNTQSKTYKDSEYTHGTTESASYSRDDYVSESRLSLTKGRKSFLPSARVGKKTGEGEVTAGFDGSGLAPAGYFGAQKKLGGDNYISLNAGQSFLPDDFSTVDQSTSLEWGQQNLNSQWGALFGVSKGKIYSTNSDFQTAGGAYAGEATEISAALPIGKAYKNQDGGEMKFSLYPKAASSTSETAKFGSDVSFDSSTEPDKYASLSATAGMSAPAGENNIIGASMGTTTGTRNVFDGFSSGVEGRTGIQHKFTSKSNGDITLRYSTNGEDYFTDATASLQVALSDLIPAGENKVVFSSQKEEQTIASLAEKLDASPQNLRNIDKFEAGKIFPQIYAIIKNNGQKEKLLKTIIEDPESFVVFVNITAIALQNRYDLAGYKEILKDIKDINSAAYEKIKSELKTRGH